MFARVRFAAGIGRHRLVPAVLFLRASAAALLIAASGACGPSQPSVPPIALDGVAPEVAAAVQAAHARTSANPSSAVNWLTLGMVCEANGLMIDARRAYEEAVRRDPLLLRGWYRLALADGRAGRLDLALEAIDRVIALDGSYAPAHWRRGLWLLESGREADARAAFEKATTLEPANPGGWIGLARLALRKQQPAQAVETLERFLSQQPGDRYAILLLGTAYQRLGKTDDAQPALAVGATGEPNWPDPWSDELSQHRVGFAHELKAATAQVLNGEFVAAIPTLERLSRERPDDLSLMHQLGLSYVAAGRASDGIRLLEHALTRDPDNVETHLRLASAYLNRLDFERALSHSERAIALDPELGRAYETRGMALWRSGRAGDALAVFEQALRFDPSNVSALVWMGSILLDAGQPDRALDHFERAVRRNPMLADAFVGIALVMVQRRRFDDAEGALGRAGMIDPQNPRLAPARARLEAARAGRGSPE